MATDARRFWIENAETLETATASGEYDMEQAGRDFWFSRNGHGVGFFDRGLGEAGDALESAAQYREIDLYAEPVPGADPDPDDSDGWTVSLCSRVDPLTDAERAALDALEGKPDAEPLETVGSRYGAPMGRSAHKLDPGAGAGSLRRVTLDPGGYDSGGAYWGLGLPLWRAIDADGSPDYFRAASRGAALEAIRAEYPGFQIAGGLANGN